MNDYGRHMMKFSLLYPENAERSFRQLSDEAVNDLSLEFILDALTDLHTERPHLLGMMTKLPTDADTIRYRHEIFEDFLRFPTLREKMSELVAKLADLRDLERFQMDSDSSALWSLINRLREIDDYMACINMIRETLTELPITSGGLKKLRGIVTDIAEESGFDELKADIDEMMAKAQKLKSITIGVNLDKFLRPENAGIVALNDAKFTDAGLMGRFKGFTDKKDDLYHGVDTGKKQRFHPANPSTNQITMGTYMVSAATHDAHIETSNVTGKDPLSQSLRKQVTEIMKRTVADIKATIKKYVNVNGYSLVSLLPEILFYNRFA